MCWLVPLRLPWGLGVDVIDEHAACAEPAQHDRPVVPGPVVCGEVDEKVDPVADDRVRVGLDRSAPVSARCSDDR